MATKFDDLELSWLRAARASFEQEDGTDIDENMRKDLFRDHLEDVLADVPNKPQPDDLLAKINKMPTDEFWKFYGSNFAYPWERDITLP
jgi:hypothetical protein